MSSSKFDTLYVGGSSFSEGGGLYIGEASGIISNCIIDSNTVELYGGGGLFIAFSYSINIENTIISRNISYENGAGIETFSVLAETVNIINSTIVFNNTLAPL